MRKVGGVLADVDQWSNGTLIKGSVAEFIADLRQREGGTIGTAGSPWLVRSLIVQGVLDELTLLISPVVAGAGRKRLFPDDAAPSKFELVEGKQTSSGALIATYRPIRSDGQGLRNLPQKFSSGKCGGIVWPMITSSGWLDFAAEAGS